MSDPIQRRDLASTQDGRRDARLAAIVDDYFERKHRGESPNVDDLLAKHPDIADELRECIAGIDLVHSSTNSDDQDRDPLQTIGDFRILREVGRGGMGVVYEAEQISLSRRVALKLLRYSVADREAMERFQREAETVANLHHSNIVPIFAVGEQDGQNYFAMQFIEGKSLADIQAESAQSIDPLDVADWGLQTAEALAYAHEQNTIHRDVKPSNLIRDEEGRVWLTDFGLAKRLDDVRLSMTGAILGTPRYMSPEQATSMRRPVDHRTDIYSLGATLYELATGKPLFDADTPHVALGQIITEDPALPSTIRPALPRDLETIIMRCISKQANDRYETAQELADDLRAFVEGRTIKARRPTLVEKLGRWLEKHRRAILIAAAAAGIAALVFFAVSSLKRHSDSLKISRVKFRLQNTPHQPVVAEIIDENGDYVLPSFTLPTQNPIKIPQGDYRLWLRTDEDLSVRHRFSVYHSWRLHGVSVETKNRRMWEPKDLDGDWELWNRKDGTDVVVFTQLGVRLLDGETSEEVWDANFTEDPTLLELLSTIGWELNWSTKSKGRKRAFVVDSDQDIDKDGVGDLILAFRFFPIHVALSGKDGSKIWQSMPKDLGPPLTEGQTLPNVEHAGVLHAPVLQDVTDDGNPELVSMIAASTSKTPTCRLVAISSETGSEVWRSDIDLPQPADEDVQFTGSIASLWVPDGPQDLDRRTHQRWYNIVTRDQEGHFHTGADLVPFPLRSVSIGETKQLVVANTEKLSRIAPALGETISETKLPFVPACPPLFFSLEKSGTGQTNGRAECVLLCEQLSVGQDAQLRLHCFDLETMQPKWKQDVQAVWDFLAPNTDAWPQWPLLEDLDADGVPEIIVPDGCTSGRGDSNLSPSGSLQVLDAKTGEPRWTQPSSVSNSEFQLSHFVVTNDLDGDSIRDLASVCFFSGPADDLDDSWTTKGFHIYVDVFSGANGKRLFWMRSPKVNRPDTGLVMPRIRSATCIGDQLFVDCLCEDRGSDSIGRVVCFSLSEQEPTLLADNAIRPAFGDTDNDGDLELFAWKPTATYKPEEGGRLFAWDSIVRPDDPSPKRWSYADDHYQPVGDVNGDGITDAIRAPPREEDDHRWQYLTMVSGATGKYLWKDRKRAPIQGNCRITTVPLNHDLDGDGANDFLVNDEMRDGWSAPLEARSGRTGKRFWEFDSGKVFWGGLCRPVGVQDVNNDGRKEILLLVQTEKHTSRSNGIYPSAFPISLFNIDSKTGNLNWHVEWCFKHNYNGWFINNMRVSLLDLNGDGVEDVVGHGVNDSGYVSIAAVSGVDGSNLWTVASEHLLTDLGLGERNSYFGFTTIEGKDSTNIVFSEFPDQNGERVSVTNLDGRTGKIRWRWLGDPSSNLGLCKKSKESISSQQHNFGFTKPIRFRTKDGECIGFWFANEEEEIEFVLLRDDDSKATVCLRKRLCSYEHDQEMLNAFQVFPIDLDGDGTDEMLYTTCDHTEVPQAHVTYHVHAWSFDDDKELWSVPTTNQPQILYAKRQKDERVEILVSIGPTALDQKPSFVLNEKGERSWEFDLTDREAEEIKDGRRSPGTYFLGSVDFLSAENASTPPYLLVRTEKLNTRSYRATRPTGSVSTQADTVREERMTAPITIHSRMKADPRLIRTPPWADSNDDLVPIMIRGTAVSAVLLGLPLWYLGWLSSGQWSMRTLMLLPLLVAVWIVFGQIEFNIFSFPFGTILQNLVISAICLPGLIWIATFASRFLGQRWKSLRWLLFWTVSVTTGTAITLLVRTQYFHETEPVRFLWRKGIHDLASMGIMFTGVGLIVVWVLRKVFGWIMYWVKRSPSKLSST